MLALLTLPVSFSADSHFKTPSWCCGGTVGCHRRWSVPPGEPSELTPGWMSSVWEAFQNLSFGLFNWTWVFYLPCFVIPIATSGTAWDTSAAILSAGWHSSLWWVNGSMCGCVSVCSLCACFSLMGQDLLKCNLWLRMIKSLQNVCFNCLQVKPKVVENFNFIKRYQLWLIQCVWTEEWISLFKWLDLHCGPFNKSNQ